MRTGSPAVERQDTAAPAGSRPGRAPEVEVATDLAHRAAVVAPLLVGVAALGWGFDGALSSAYAVALVVANLLVSAALLAWAARISLPAVMATALGGYLVRLGLVVAAVWAVKDATWVAMVPLGVTLVVTHLGLLTWEARFVSLSLAFPGLKPGPQGEGGRVP